MDASVTLDRTTIQRRSDEALMLAIVADQPIALDALLSRYWAPLVRFAYRFGCSKDAAEDVVQECFVCLWERRKEWQPTGSVRSFLYRVARNLALNESRFRRVRLERRDDVSDATNTAPVTPGERFEESEIRRAVEQAISDLPRRRREIFILARYHNLSYAEIAEALGISPQTVANQMSSALRTLRKSLGHRLGT
jgi:RNA polymerase sigma-70 factor, ECF subfamily